ETMVEGGREEDGAGAAADRRAPLADPVRGRAALGPVGAVNAVVLDAKARRHEEAVPESKRLLEQARPGMAAGIEGRAALRVAALGAVFAADGRGGPLADVKVVQQLG